MPTLLDLCDIPIPDTCDGISMVGSEKRPYLYGECGEDDHASRMIHEQRYKLIYYPVGNHFQLFDLDNDPNELNDLAGEPAAAELLARMQALLVAELYGSDAKWLDDGKIVGEPARRFHPAPNRGLSMTRGQQWPVPLINPKGDMVFFPELKSPKA